MYSEFSAGNLCRHRKEEKQNYQVDMPSANTKEGGENSKKNTNADTDNRVYNAVRFNTCLINGVD